jgi:hypothetical protein
MIKEKLWQKARMMTDQIIIQSLINNEDINLVSLKLIYKTEN